jgi:4,5-DOPA dioxygenase extradiol
MSENFHSIMTKSPALFIPHGGGPMPILDHPSQRELAYFLKTTGKHWLGNPNAIIVVTAHWETEVVTITGNDDIDLLYDYYGFPKESYEFKYPAKGSSKVANIIKNELERAGIKCSLDKNRNWDHGVFIPLMMMGHSSHSSLCSKKPKRP